MITAIALVAAYLIGSIPSGLWIGKIFFHKNLHEFGSGNTGTTNTFRTLGVPAGIVVFAVDLFKGTLAVLLPVLLGIHGISPLIFGLLAVLGHTVSIFDNFKGGKAVATSAGVILGYTPVFFLFLLVIFIIVLLLFSMISLSSVTAAIAAILGVLIFPLFHFILSSYDPIFTGIIIILGLIILTRHHSNLSRIRHREENVVPFGLNLSRQKKSRE
ncbi:glycerol-3-phosphate 1-O-acyltransferase PlsY [Lactovum odontotermitis]